MAHFYNSVVTILLICFTNMSLMMADDVQMAQEAFTKLSQNAAPTDRQQEGSYANYIMDSALQQFFDTLREQNVERVKIPDAVEEFSKKVGLVRVRGNFRARNGFVEGLTTLHRAGDAKMFLDAASILFDAPLALDSLHVEMDYTARFKPVSVSGKLRANVRGNAAKCSGGLKFHEGQCHVVLNTLELTELGKIDLHVTGLGPLNWIYSKIATVVTSKMHKDIKEKVVNEMRRIVENEMKDLECPPELIPH